VTKPPTFRLIVPEGAIEAFASIREAKDGDPSRLAERIRAGADLRDDERAFAADLLDGKVKRARHRPKKAATAARRREIAQFVHLYRHYHDCKLDAAVMTAEQAFSVSRKHVFDALRELKSDPDVGHRIDEIFAGFAAVLRSGVRPGEGPMIDVPLASPGPIYPSND